MNYGLSGRNDFLTADFPTGPCGSPNIRDEAIRLLKDINISLLADKSAFDAAMRQITNRIIYPTPSSSSFPSPSTEINSTPAVHMQPKSPYFTISPDMMVANPDALHKIQNIRNSLSQYLCEPSTVPPKLSLSDPNATNRPPFDVAWGAYNQNLMHELHPQQVDTTNDEDQSDKESSSDCESISSTNEGSASTERSEESYTELSAHPVATNPQLTVMSNDQPDANNCQSSAVEIIQPMETEKVAAELQQTSHSSVAGSECKLPEGSKCLDDSSASIVLQDSSDSRVSISDNIAPSQSQPSSALPAPITISTPIVPLLSIQSSESPSQSESTLDTQDPPFLLEKATRSGDSKWLSSDQRQPVSVDMSGSWNQSRDNFGEPAYPSFQSRVFESKYRDESGASGSLFNKSVHLKPSTTGEKDEIFPFNNANASSRYRDEAILRSMQFGLKENIGCFDKQFSGPVPPLSHGVAIDMSNGCLRELAMTNRRNQSSRPAEVTNVGASSGASVGANVDLGSLTYQKLKELTGHY